MQVPDSFVLPNPLDPESFPPPSPPKFLKHQVYENPEIFNLVDKHAIQVSKREHMTFRELMWDLVYRVRLMELERARVIFRWMTSKNMYEIRFDQELPGTPEDILTSFRKRKGTLARILEVMCCFAHIPCVSISGYAKGVEYLPGQKFQGRPANHSWNAIYIQDAWQLIDAHWATRYLSSDKNLPENLVYEYDDFYFVMEPQQAVYSHFPNLEAWQLLERPLTLQQFEDLPLTKSQFFKCGMDFRQQHHGVVHTREGKLKMCLGFWKPGSFTYGLQYGEAMEESFAGTPLKNYALQETLDVQLNFFFRLPLTGVYYLTVYASDAGAMSRSNSPQSRSRQVVAESVFRAACEYKIVCDQAAPDATPYPACHDVNWGPAWPLVQHYGLEPSVHDGVIPTHTGSVEVRFGRQRPEVNLLAKMRRNGIDDDILDQFLHEYVAEDTGEVVFTVQLPEGGEYGMEVYANDPAYEGDTYTHICQYMLSFQAPPGYRSKLQSAQQQTAAQRTQANPRQMWNYEDHAPSMGTLPKPYLAGEVDAVGQMTEGMSRMPGSAAPGSGAYQYQPGDQVEMAQPGRQALRPGMGGSYQYHPGAQVEPVSETVQPQEQSTPLYKAAVTAGDSPRFSHLSKVPEAARKTGEGSPRYEVRSASPASAQSGRGGSPRYEVRAASPGAAGGSPASGGSPKFTRAGRLGGPGVQAFQGQDDSVTVSMKAPMSAGVNIPVNVSASAQWQGKPSAGAAVDDRMQNVPGGQYGLQGQMGPGGKGQMVPGGQIGIAGQMGGPGGAVDDRMQNVPGGQYGLQGQMGPGGKGQMVPGGQIGIGGKGQVRPGGLAGTTPGSGGRGAGGSESGSSSSSGSSTSGSDSEDSTKVSAADKRGDNAQRKTGSQDGFDQYNRTAEGAPNLLEPVMAYNPEQSTADWSQKNIGMMPPPEFHPQPVEPMSAPKPLLNAIPTDRELNQISSDRSDKTAMQKFEKIDSHAMDVSKKTQENFNQLIWQLIYARQITDDLEKIRAIFAWLCTKDLSKMNFVGVKENTPEDILMGIKTGKSTYAQIFQILCQYAAVHCTIVPGYAKGAEYVPGMRFSGRQGQHSWNAVLVSGVWRLVDCHWAARRLIGKQSSIENIRYELDMFYFLPNPAHLIYTHFPFDKEWQLLKDPLPLAEFESLAPVKSAFFKFGLQLKTHKHAVVSCSEEMALKISHPPGAEDQLSFTYTLGFADAVGSSPGELEEWKGRKLIQYGMQEMTPDHCSTFTVRPPRPGAYKFLIYAKRADSDRQDVVFGAVCEYRIESDFPMEMAMPPFPPCQNHSYGPCDAAKRYKLVSSSPSAVLQTGNSAVAEVRMRLDQPGVRMMAKLRSVRHSDDQLARCLLMRHIADREVIVSVFPPDGGEFGLELYASDAQTETTSYYMVWQYLVVAAEASPVRGLPTIPASFLGPLPRFAQFGLETVSHVDPFIQTTTGDLCVQVRSNSGPLRMMAQLIVATNDTNDDCSQFVLQQSKLESVFFLLRFPRPGYYKFVVFALPYSDPSESIPAVFNYLVEASLVARAQSPFPQQFQQWKEGCYLHSPLDGQINPAGPYVNFDMEVPKATAVAVVIGDDWTQLERLGGPGSDRWKADVYVEKHMSEGGGKRVSVCANYGAYNSSYSTILEYKL